MDAGVQTDFANRIQHPSWRDTRIQCVVFNRFEIRVGARRGIEMLREESEQLCLNLARIDDCEKKPICAPCIDNNARRQQFWACPTRGFNGDWTMINVSGAL